MLCVDIPGLNEVSYIVYPLCSFVKLSQQQLEWSIKCQYEYLLKGTHTHTHTISINTYLSFIDHTTPSINITLNDSSISKDLQSADLHIHTTLIK